MLDAILDAIIDSLKLESKELYAKPSNELTLATGMLVTSQKALTVETPILTPVKEPGPILQANKSKSDKSNL